ncbi:chromatin remodeling protein EBS isoform X1 [Physcomitrium patens]|nr:chromatin remodeling protein EBS-like isoform X1 [Physcomitrium patens]XP_024385621.1 chromatin remodeling protein EBS-like isoform X1 [Physcomitrium patens]XP_024385622.1 chromatin remodeling protein EBS-like isoform X1 [Physcomitrium patens]XP_024385623.1 chromatin remodeling protein EBS-like isoform X1 [Physcomitrium patens]XP_024385624.1 chromatin remodeling protein EBS-like isoform X1 [Physcomitrium patens]XP_024385625.1 chromatin remodeling protein EBS-like isoform X1 [Physcomitrium p|eukprot:XP_024385620.1 chromatin remodeling protein EBS-like isoform X1 [Physcomitrella patens]
MCSMTKKRTTKSRLDYYRIANTQKIIKPGDTVTLRPPDLTTPPYVARIELIELDAAEKITLKVRWYYRPEESAGGRRQFHGSKELFLSDHYDVCSPEAVENKCTIHTFKDYTRLEDVGTDDYFCRFDYNARSGTFSPDRVAVYCKCEMPYNPDDLMVQCENCKDWFHPKCVMLSSEDIKNVKNFHCPDCINS